MGTKIEGLKNIDFPNRSTGVWIQNGRVSLVTKAADTIGLAHKISLDNMFKLRIKNVKKTLQGIMEIKDE